MPKRKGGRYTPPKNRATAITDEGVTTFRVPKPDKVIGVPSGIYDHFIAAGAPVMEDGRVVVPRVSCGHCEWTRDVPPFAGTDDGEEEDVTDDAWSVGMLHLFAAHPTQAKIEVTDPQAFVMGVALYQTLEEEERYELTHHEGRCCHE